MGWYNTSMFWADEIAEKLNDKDQHISDGKTPSGRIHVGSLRGVLIHDVVLKALQSTKTKAKFSYIFDDIDAFDDVPAGFDRGVYEKHIGKPLIHVPSPDNSAESFGKFFAMEFANVIKKVGVEAEILWQSKLYKDGILDKEIKIALDNAEKIQDIYKKVSGSQKKEQGWFPFQPICQNCGKIATTKATGWDGKEVSYECLPNLVTWANGCGHKGKMSPYGGTGKLPWKVYWPARWVALKSTVEGEGKDLASKGGARDTANHLAKEIFDVEPPLDIPYEFFLIGGAKMSTSKGIGASALEMSQDLPAQLVRFLMLRYRPMQAINFDPAKDYLTLFDEYQKAANAYFDKTDPVLARIFELSQIGETQKPPSIRFSVLTQWVQMPNMEEEIKKQELSEWATYARIWVEKYAPESERFAVQKNIPEQVKNLSGKQKEFLKKVASELSKEWNAEEFQKQLYEWAKEIGISSKEAFAAIYSSLIGKDHGPKAGWLILSLDNEFVKKRFEEVQIETADKKQSTNLKNLNKPEIFSIDSSLKQKFPSISVGVAIIRGVNIEKTNSDLENEKKDLLSSFENLTTEQLGQYPEIVSYRKLYKEMGVDWHSKRPSPEALLRRVALKKGLYNVNTCVDAYNLVVMKHRVSIGAFDEDTIKYPTVLRLAKESEDILLLGDSEPTKYTEKEIAYFDKEGGINMDFNYRDAQRTAVQLTTKNLYINVDGVYDITPQEVEHSLKETCNIIIKYCGGELIEFGIES